MSFIKSAHFRKLVWSCSVKRAVLTIFHQLNKKLFASLKNIARIANAVQCPNWLSDNKDCHGFRFSIFRIVISVSNVKSSCSCKNCEIMWCVWILNVCYTFWLRVNKFITLITNGKQFQCVCTVQYFHQNCVAWILRKGNYQ